MKHQGFLLQKLQAFYMSSSLRRRHRHGHPMVIPTIQRAYSATFVVRETKMNKYVEIRAHYFFFNLILSSSCFRIHKGYTYIKHVIVHCSIHHDYKSMVT